MNHAGHTLPPSQRLAIAYAPAGVRETFSVLLLFDAKIAGIATKTSEILIGQMKIAWWRDAIAAEPQMRPKAEPLIARITALEWHRIEPELLTLLDAWESLLVGAGNANSLQAFANARAAAIFGGYTRLVGCDADVQSLGAGWAKADLTGNAGSPDPAVSKLPTNRVLRPLTILALSVRDVSGPRLLWHALTGR